MFDNALIAEREMLKDEAKHPNNYMPSNWSKRYGPIELQARFLKFCENVTRKTRSSIAHELNVPYGSSERAKYDIYGTDLPDDAPIFIFIHGGYWMEFSKDLSGFSVPNFVAHGIKVVVAGYDLCPNVRLTDIVQQIKLLVEKIIILAQSLKSKCIWLGGHSAGAHLAESLLHDHKWRASKHSCLELLKGLVPIGGIYDLKPVLSLSVNEAVKLTSEEISLYTFAPIDELKKLENNSECISNLKVILAVGECDSPIFVEESKRYARRLIQFVDNIKFLLLRNHIDHFDIVENLTTNDLLLSKILIHNVKNIK
ncbi:kynurenine formamidase [Copidosoma floridanum]|uniref:kynurenine formamidase n=1 Tax=Copidosoma floridanum TaxID=29053 RepID=UPI000C6F509B|nr:kynurenine formamidase [Copidosoma floridanum]